MNMKQLFIGLPCLLILLSGCSARYGVDHFIQREPTVVAIVPSFNRSANPEAQIILDKAWVDKMHDLGFHVINSDQVITYAVSQGVLIKDLEQTRMSQLAKDLDVDFLLLSEIDVWDTKYRVLDAYSKVKGRTKLVEGVTEALVWEYPWEVVIESGGGGGGLEMLANAMATAVVHAATEQAARMARSAVRNVSQTLPRPGFAPGSQRDYGVSNEPN